MDSFPKTKKISVNVVFKSKWEYTAAAKDSISCISMFLIKIKPQVSYSQASKMQRTHIHTYKTSCNFMSCEKSFLCISVENYKK